MNFRTELSLHSSSPLALEQNIFSMGSCFAENISGILQSYRLPVCSNPFGITYNPLSMAKSLQSLLDQRLYSVEDLREHQGLFFSLDHHGDFADSCAASCLEKIQQSSNRAQQALRESSLMILTLGTAFVYRDRETGAVVNNCHRLPASHFERSLAPFDEIVTALSGVLKQVLALNPQLKIFLSVSPIRHLRDNFPQNSLSKAQLISAVHVLAEELTQVEYLPIYELMIDDLRDYRFYAADMIHPNDLAIDYIWQKFSQAYFDEASHRAFKRIDQLNQRQNHRPRNTQSKQYKDFVAKTRQIQQGLEQDYPFLNWSEALC